MKDRIAQMKEGSLIHMRNSVELSAGLVSFSWHLSWIKIELDSVYEDDSIIAFSLLNHILNI